MHDGPEPDPPTWPRHVNGRDRLHRLGRDGRYELQSVYGDGGQAYIWYAQDVVTGTAVAVKTARPDGSLGRGRVAARRMIREARIMASIPAHPNVMPLLDCGPRHLVRPEAEGLRPDRGDPFEARDPWLVMPLVPHRRLDDLISADPMTPDAWLRLARAYAAGLAHLHENRVVHRDLSPGNVLLTADGPVITDFGVSWAPRWVDDEGVDQMMSTGLTRDVGAGTEDWHAPEQTDTLPSERPDRRPAYDVFSWGLFVATASARRHPWSETLGNDRLHEFERRRMRTGGPANELSGPLAEAGGWAELVEAALARDPADRPSAAELVATLDDERSGRRRAARRPSVAAPEPAAERDAAVVAVLGDLRASLLERWMSDPLWNRVGPGRRLPIAWTPVDDGDSDGPDAAARLIRLWQRGARSRTIVFGDAGSGKTELLVGVFRQLVGEENHGRPVPLYVPLASWEPQLGDLRSWLIEWLHVNHRFLNRPAEGPVRKSEAAKLLDSGRFAVILDGLDEVLGKAPLDMIAEQLNNFDGPSRILVSCRDEGGVADEVFPTGTTVRLRSQDLGDVLSFLGRREPDRLRWEPVAAALADRPDLAEVFRTPLMVMLADALCNGEAGADPRQLLDLRGTEAIRQHLLRGFVPARYPAEGAGYDEIEAGRWLGYLARMVGGGGELRWWDLRVLSAPSSRSSRVRLHVLTLVAVVAWTALSAGVMNTGVFGSTTTGLTDAIRIPLAALVCYGAIWRVTGRYPAAVLAVLGAYITGTLSGSYDLATATGLVAGFSWRPLSLRPSGRGGDLLVAAQVGVAAAVAVAVVRLLSLVVPLHGDLVMGYAAGTLDGFTVRWDEDVNGWLATGLAAGLFTWIGMQVTRGPTTVSRAGPVLPALITALLVTAVDSWADGARPGVDQPWLIAPSDGLAAGLAVWWVVTWAGRRIPHRATAAVLGGLTFGLNVLAYTQRPDVDAPVIRALGEGAALAILVWVAFRTGPYRRMRTLGQILPPVLTALAAGLLIGILHTQSAGPARGGAAGVAVALAVAFFLVRGHARSGPARVDPIEAGIVGLTVVALLAGFAYALMFALVAGLGSRVSSDIAQRRLPSLRMSAPPRNIAIGALLGVMAAFAAGANGFPAISLILIALTGGVAGAFTFGVGGDDPRNRLAASPTRLFRADRGVFLRMTTVIALTIGAAVGIRTSAGGQPLGSALLSAVAVLLTYGLTAGLVIAASSTRYGVFTVRSAWLAADDRLPWRLMRFLDDAHARRQVLRAAGSSYQFRHELLREQIAEVYREPDRPR